MVFVCILNWNLCETTATPVDFEIIMKLFLSIYNKSKLRNEFPKHTAKYKPLYVICFGRVTIRNKLINIIRK